MKTVTLKGKSTKDISLQLGKIISNLYKPTLAIVFLSIQQDFKVLTALLNSQDIQGFGSTTSGEFIDGDIEKGSIVMMLIDMNPVSFKLEFLEIGEQTTFENAKQLGLRGKSLPTSVAYIIVSGWLTEDGENIIDGITEGYGKDVTIFGGMAGDDLKLEGTLVFTENNSSDKGLLTLIINQDKIDVNGIATCGWRPIGTTKTITESTGNIVYTKDNKPALDTILKYLGAAYDFDSGKEIVSQLGAYYPLQMEREGVAPVMRTAMFANKEDRSIICAGHVLQGSKIKFSLPPDFDVIEKVVEECQELKAEKLHSTDALIMFSGISRHMSFGHLMEEEINQV